LPCDTGAYSSADPTTLATNPNSSTLAANTTNAATRAGSSVSRTLGQGSRSSEGFQL